MNIKELKKRISKYGGVEKLLKNLQRKGIIMSRTSYFRKIKSKTEFTRSELIGIADELNMNNIEICDIFFKQ